MLICEECRTRNNWVRENQLDTGDCEWCWTRNCTVSDIMSFIKDEVPEVAFELRKIAQQQRNEDFKTMADALCVFDTYGPRAGSFNDDLTSQLRQIVVQVNGQTLGGHIPPSSPAEGCNSQDGSVREGCCTNILRNQFRHDSKMLAVV